MSSRRTKPPNVKERALDEIYADIPNIPDCTGACASACGPIAMFGMEWKRVKRSFGETPRVREQSRCPMLSPVGRCMVYTARPYICRLWGTTPTLKCPEGCQPERWLTLEQAREIYERIRVLAGPEIAGPLGGVDDLWDAIALERRRHRASIIESIERGVTDGSET